MNPDLQQVIKNLQDLKDTSLDVILPSLYHTQIYLYTNVQKSFCGAGCYKLCNAFKFLKRDIDELLLPAKIYEPSQIVKIFRVRGITLFADNGNGEDEDNTSLLQAQRIVEMENITHCGSLKAFLVKSTTGAYYRKIKTVIGYIFLGNSFGEMLNICYFARNISFHQENAIK